MAALWRVPLNSAGRGDESSTPCKLLLHCIHFSAQWPVNSCARGLTKIFHAEGASLGFALLAFDLRHFLCMLLWAILSHPPHLQLLIDTALSVHFAINLSNNLFTLVVLLASQSWTEPIPLSDTSVDSNIAPSPEFVLRTGYEKQSRLRQAPPRPRLVSGKAVEYAGSQYRPNPSHIHTGTGLSRRKRLLLPALPAPLKSRHAFIDRGT
jgi:hypothetical protein